MNQSKLESLIESCANTAIGFFVSLLTWQLIAAPYLGLSLPMHENLIVTGIFTVVSVLRGYVVRRFFNAGLHKAVHSLVSMLKR